MKLFRHIVLSAALSGGIALSRSMNAVQLFQPISFTEALESRAVRSLLPTSLTSDELAEISEDLLERALFSARTLNAEYLQEISDVLDTYLRGHTDLATARLQLKTKLIELSYQPVPGEEGSIKDLSSSARVDIVLKTNAGMAQGYGTWMQGQSTAVLDQWPAQQLYRAFNRRVPRNWIARWTEAGGEIFGGRMIALKNKRIWTTISRFGTPYPPFDFNSGMSVRDIDRDTAIELGLIDRDTQIAPQDRGFNDDLKLEPAVRDAALRQALEDLGYEFSGDTLTLGENG